MEEGAHLAYSPLPALLVLWPLVAALFVVPLGRWRESIRNAFVVVATGVALLGATALIPLIATERRVTCEIPGLVGRLVFTVDSFSMLFALFTTFVWFCSTLYAIDYLKHEHARDRYHVTNLVVLAAMLGVVLAGDLITLYLFFEALGLVAFLFVIHTETDDAKRASIKYFWMTPIGGFLLIGGIFLTYALGGTGAIGPFPAEHGAETLRWAAFVLLLLGFGVKAGMLPVHVWLPDAHPVAPSPASALLSGVMIKAGAYGIFRTVTALFRPEVWEHIEETLWHFSSQIGLVVLWAGIATMFIGVVLALGQHDAKRMLAYHSVSQMGFILAGIGAAGYLGAEGAMGYAGGLYHIVNHALFKAALFLGVGAVYVRTASLDMYKLGGLWKKMPLTFLFTAIAAAGITGVPLFNGFVSKCLVHHAIVEAWELHEVWSLGVAEKIYMITCGGTACSFIKLIGLVFLGKPKAEYGPEVRDASPRMLGAMGLLSVPIIVLGWRPDLLLKGVFEPGLHTWGLESEILEHFLDVYFLSYADLMSVVWAFAIGFAVFFLGMRWGLFRLKAPEWFGVDHWYRRGAIGLVTACEAVAEGYEALRQLDSRGLRRLGVAYHAETDHADRAWRRFTVTLFTGATGLHAQYVIQEAYVALERERQATVHYAIDAAIRRLREHADTDQEHRRAMIDAVRDISSYTAMRLFKERMGVLSDTLHVSRSDDVRYAFARIAGELGAFRKPVAETAIDLARRRIEGENVLRETSAATNRVMSEERFDRRLDSAMPCAHRTARPIREALPSAAAVGDLRDRGLGTLEQTGKWAADMARLIVQAVTQERVTWMMADHVDTGSVALTRRQIQRYARDMSFNVAVLVVVLLAFLVALAGNR